MGRTDRERGAAAVEFALVVPLLLLLVVGIAEFGRAYNAQTTLSGAAREGVRVMALHDDAAAARTATQAAASPLVLSSSQISVSPTSCASSSATDSTATVRITYPLDFVGGFFGASVTLTGKAVMRCNG
ncbi:TadE/TadG family type IV pilus assembly protein [Auraticoccus monumenti]|uniref:TadE-like protein n=1 Tax=Auraticoccus monumenti TaxID=675864 RepID=A0A1G6YD58_9ACTN|nr:TadE family protein [Auraticoccus monumenti]SDD87667.1 TadE-like protein [Auraticoccus monumenti]